MKIAILISRYHKIAEELLATAQAFLDDKGVETSVFEATGAFEIPLLAQELTQYFDGVICLGCIIKGDSYHFEAIADNCARGIMDAMLKVRKPITFGVLTAYTDEQANARGTKGREAAEACYQAVLELKRISELLIN